MFTDRKLTRDRQTAILFEASAPMLPASVPTHVTLRRIGIRVWRASNDSSGVYGADRGSLRRAWSRRGRVWTGEPGTYNGPRPASPGIARCSPALLAGPVHATGPGRGGAAEDALPLAAADLVNIVVVFLSGAAAASSRWRGGMRGRVTGGDRRSGVSRTMDMPKPKWPKWRCALIPGM